MHTWTIKTDRRQIKTHLILDELHLLEQSVLGLQIRIFDDHRFEQSPDERGFRDFAPIAEISHKNLAALEIVAEELLAQFGWLIDFSK